MDVGQFMGWKTKQWAYVFAWHERAFPESVTSDHQLNAAMEVRLEWQRAFDHEPLKSELVLSDDQFSELYEPRHLKRANELIFKVIERYGVGR